MTKATFDNLYNKVSKLIEEYSTKSDLESIVFTSALKKLEEELTKEKFYANICKADGRQYTYAEVFNTCRLVTRQITVNIDDMKEHTKLPLYSTNMLKTFNNIIEECLSTIPKSSKKKCPAGLDIDDCDEE